MRKFLTIFVAVVLVTSMSILMVGCKPKTPDNPDPEVIKVSTIANQIDLTKGLVIRADAELSISGTKSDISIVAKAKNENKQTTIDVEMTTTNGGENSYDKYYIRNDDLYVSQKNEADIANEEFKKTTTDDSEQGNKMIKIITAIINSDAKELAPLFDSFIEFTQDGETVYGTLDVKKVVLDYFDKIFSAIFGDSNTQTPPITENTTIGELSQRLELHEEVTKIFGDMTIDKIYSIVKPILTDCGETELPENSDALIALWKTRCENKGISIVFPKPGNKTVVEYVDEFIEQNKDKKVGDLIGDSINDFNGFSQLLNFAKQPIRNIRNALEKCTATVTILTDTKGKIISLNAEVKIHNELITYIQSLKNLIDTLKNTNIPIMPTAFARPVATSEYLYDFSVQAKFEHTATDFKDASTFKIAQ